jgi:creatinine deaminase
VGWQVLRLSPVWYCSGLVRQFGIGSLVIGSARTFSGGHDWLAENGVDIVILDDNACVSLPSDFIETHPSLWHHDINVPDAAG